MTSKRSYSASRAERPQLPKPPTIPYISLPDRYLSNYFTQARIRKHLLQAGLLTKDGHIITQAEYESKKKDISIGRENQQKRDEAIRQVFNEMGEQHNKLLNGRLKETKQDLIHEFRRIEKQYARRTQPIKITVAKENRTPKLIPVSQSSPPLPSDQNEKESTFEIEDPDSSQLSNELKNIQEKLAELTNNQSALNEKLKALSTDHSNNMEKRRETNVRFDQHDQQIELTLRNLNETVSKLTEDINEKFHRLESQNGKMQPSSSLTRVEVENLVRINLETWQLAVNDKLAKLEKQLNDCMQSNNSYVTPSSNKPTMIAPQLNMDLQKRIDLIEQQLKDRIVLLQNQVDGRKNEIKDIREQVARLSGIINELTNQIKDLNHTKKLDEETVRKRRQENMKSGSESVIINPRKLIDESEQRMKTYVQDKLQDLKRLSNSQPNDQSRKHIPSTSMPQSSKKIDNLQALMPFIEVLPTFNLFANEDWD